MTARPGAPTFLWHDYETWGGDPRRDRPCQFASIRTDADLVEIGEPCVWYCRPATDLLPHPEACLVTGITPQIAERKGLRERDFATAILAEMSRPGTCGVGYNSLRFDDEITRNLFYRNLLDPYAREWRNGNSRWDLIDTLRLAHALRPDGIVWPTHEDGTTSFKLEALTAANGIDHGQAHDALADVRATIALARLLRRVQPRLFDYALSLRDKARVRAMLDEGRPLLHASARFPAALGCLAPILPIRAHPTNTNGVVCADLRIDPEQWVHLSADELRERLFVPASELDTGIERPPLKTVHLNRAPVLAPMKTLTPTAAERWSIDPERVAAHARRLQQASRALAPKLEAVFRSPEGPATTDPDLMIYSGGFFSDADRRAMDALHRLDPKALASADPRFEDPRLPTLLFRLRARNWPEALTPEERDDWDLFRLARLSDPDAGGSLVIDDYERRLDELAETHANDPAKLAILDTLAEWGARVMDADA